MSSRKNKSFNPDMMTEGQKDLLKVVSQISSGSPKNKQDSFLKKLIKYNQMQETTKKLTPQSRISRRNLQLYANGSPKMNTERQGSVDSIVCDPKTESKLALTRSKGDGTGSCSSGRKQSLTVLAGSRSRSLEEDDSVVI